MSSSIMKRDEGCVKKKREQSGKTNIIPKIQLSFILRMNKTSSIKKKSKSQPGGSGVVGAPCS